MVTREKERETGDGTGDEIRVTNEKIRKMGRVGVGTSL